MSQTKVGLGMALEKKFSGMITFSGRLHSLQVNDRGLMSVVGILR
ncbi:MAG: hypothetical protein WBQ85_12710 [Candidatus Sulfotelmatobacter sp.]